MKKLILLLIFLSLSSCAFSEVETMTIDKKTELTDDQTYYYGVTAEEEGWRTFQSAVVPKNSFLTIQPEFNGPEIVVIRYDRPDEWEVMEDIVVVFPPHSQGTTRMIFNLPMKTNSLSIPKGTKIYFGEKARKRA